jgi:hypothetical protein
VDVVPDASRFTPTLRRQLVPEATRIGEQIGAEIGRTAAMKVNQALRDLHAGVKVDADTAGAATHMDEWRAAHGKDLHVGVDVDTAGATAQLEVLEREETRVRDKAAEAAGVQGMGALATAGIALGPALIPVMAGVAAATGALGAAFGAAAIGAAGVAVVAIPAIKQVTDVQSKLTTLTTAYNAATTDKQRATVLAKERALWEALSGPQQAALRALQAFKGEYEKWSQALQPLVLEILPPLLGAAREGMTLLTPIIKAAAVEMKFLGQDLQLALGSPLWKSFAASIAGSTGQAISEFGHIIGNLATGFAGLLQAFTPLALKMGSGLVDLTGKFADWGVHLGESSAFHKFLDYVKETGPLVWQALQKLADAVGKIATALAPLAPPLLKGITGLLGIVTKLSTTDLQAIAVGISAIAVGTKAWSLAMLLLDANPVVLVGVAVLGVAAAFALAWEHSRTFRDVMKGVFDVVGTVVIGFGLVLAHSLLDPIRAVLWVVEHIPGPWQSWAKSAVKDIDSVYGAIIQAKRALDDLTNPKKVDVTYVGHVAGVYPADFIGPVPSGGKTVNGTYYAPTFIGPVPEAPSTGLKALARASGGMIPGYAPGVDSVLAMLSPGEAVLRPEVARWLGEDTINAWNASATHFASGGLVYRGESGAYSSSSPAAMTSGASGGHLRGGLVIENLNVVSAPGEPAATSVPRGLRNLALTYGL